ncbi:uncharacterized protein PgNI_02861 [Pyricularia grisea]|uniref:Uncharacterized protein n=1 Tax=Pyricularia grisea TaxID=148305 RepID=A0A6P8BAY2_PYRGI|nr:uncharacterized protein PgNI_02861 [Pyricularia grisea]TLD12948.1 hypothetical protein PgNI_02861 [Pyricularia grisea]
MQFSKIILAIAIYTAGTEALPTPVPKCNGEVATNSNGKLNTRSTETFYYCSKCGFGTNKGSEYFSHKC